jgi:tetratricopeptide (TPR) repeat protein
MRIRTKADNRQLRAWRLYAVLCVLAFPAIANKAADYVHYQLGVKYKNENKYDQAIIEFRKVLAAYPDNYNAYMHLAQMRLRQGRDRLAIHNLKKSLTYNPGWGKAHKMLAVVYERDRQYHNAIQELQLYSQSCDPDERDSIQTAISRLVSIVQRKEDGTPQQREDEERTDRPPASAQSAPKQARRTTRQGSRRPARPATRVDETFRSGVLLYQHAVNEQDDAKLREAMEKFHKTLQLQPGHAGAYYYAGLIRRRQGKNDMARVNFERAISFPELGYNAHFYLGKIHGEQGKYVEAIKHLRQYRKLTDYEPGRREAALLIERYEEAMSPAQRETLKVDASAVGRSELHREISKIPPEASYAPVEVRIDSLLTMAIVDTLTDPGQALLGGVRAFTRGNYDGAIELFKQTLLKYPRGDIAARCHYNIGICYLKLGDYPAAENQFQQVIERYSNAPIAAKSLFLKALTYYERNDYQVAERLFRQFIQSYRTHQWIGKAYERLGDSYAGLEDGKKAADAYAHAFRRAAGPADKVYASYKLGEAYAGLGNVKSALTAFDNAIEAGEKASVYERVPDSHYKMADLLYKEGRADKALGYYKRAVRKFPSFQDTPWGLFQIGNIYRNDGNYEDAIKAYKVVIDKFPDDYWARQAEWKMEDAVWEHEYRSVLQ